MRGFDEQIEKCIACSEMTKNWLAEKPIFKESNCTNVYQWNKIGQIKLKSEDKLQLDSYIPVMEILLSTRPFNEDQINDRYFNFASFIFYLAHKNLKQLKYLRQFTNVKAQIWSLDR